MKNILRNLKLIDYLTIELEISKTEFIEKLSAITEIGHFSGIFSQNIGFFSSSDKAFIGRINSDGFNLRRNPRFFETTMAVASGTLSEHNGHLTIKSEINGFPNFSILICIFLLIFYSYLIFDMCRSNNTDLITIIMSLLVGALMFLISYFIMTNSVKRLKYILEREFFYLTK